MLHTQALQIHNKSHPQSGNGEPHSPTIVMKKSVITVNPTYVVFMKTLAFTNIFLSGFVLIGKNKMVTGAVAYSCLRRNTINPGTWVHFPILSHLSPTK